jgi:class 3 adenylate cyclase
VLGDGPVDLVYVPGYMTNVEQNWEWPPYARFFERLASFSRLILYDRRGTGMSDRIQTLGSFDETVDDLVAVMEAAGSSRAALWGGAEGGPTCMLFAATYPERTAALVLYASYAKRTWAPDYPWGLSKEMDARIVRGFVERWGREPMGIHVMAPSAAEDPSFREWYLRALRFGGTPGSALAWYRMTADIDVRPLLPAIRVPTLVLHRVGDRVIPVESGRHLAQHIPGARYVELPGADHLNTVGSDDVADEMEEFLTGSRPMPEADRVLSTVLFTDIVGSTERAAELGDRRWRELLERHDGLVRENLERFRGREVKTAGDGFLATFDGPARGIRSAAAIAEAVSSLGLRIRAGLHTGEIELAGADVRGIAVHIAARVMAMAGPGEVLVSGTVKDLVVGSGIGFEDRGTHELKGVPGEWRLFAVAEGA